MSHTQQPGFARPGAYGLSVLLFGALLGSGCSTAKSLTRVRTQSAETGTRVEIAGSLAELSQQVPILIRDLGYGDIRVDPGLGGSVVVYAATAFSRASVGHAVRITLAAAGATEKLSRVDLALACRFRASEGDNLRAARTHILAALAERFP